MKQYILRSTFLMLLCSLTLSGFAQESLRDRMMQQDQKQNNTTGTTMSVRALQSSRTSNDALDNAKWSRIIYRYLDLNNEKNAALYYPEMPEEGRMNLFTLIFKLLAEDKINAYEYLDGREVFTDRYKLDFTEFLERFSVYYSETPEGIVVEDVDIPSNEVLGYFVKEAYYFETGTSNHGVKTLAICPVIDRQDDYNAGSVRYPLFWVPYEEIMPYALRMPIITSDLNNTLSGTIDDFFRKRNYEGEIYKTGNARNLALSQQANSPEELQAEQDKIELQLINFENNLWKEKTDSTAVVQKGRKKKVKVAKSASSSSSSGSNSMRDRRY